jgi:hypothetical protein
MLQSIAQLEKNPMIQREIGFAGKKNTKDIPTIAPMKFFLNNLAS